MPDPTTQPLIQVGDMTYLGFITVPQAQFAPGGASLALHPDGSFFYGGAFNSQTIGRVSHPAVGGTATVVQSPTNVPGSLNPPSNTTEVAGAFVWNNRLIVTMRDKYNTSAYQNYVTAGTLSIAGFSTMRNLAGVEGHLAGGYMGPIPAEWRTLLGGPAFMGNGAMSIVSQCTQGPSFYVFNPDDVGVTEPVPNFKLLVYGAGTSFQWGYTDNPTNTNFQLPNSSQTYYSRADSDHAGLVFPSGSRSVLYIHRHGYGIPTYKQPDGCQGTPGVADSGAGEGTTLNGLPWASGLITYRYQVTAYDANDFLAVKNGTKQITQIFPYGFWVLPTTYVDGCAHFTTALNNGYCLAWDETARRMYIVMSDGNIHVWAIAGGGAAPAPPSAPTGFRII
jgi:hypothetical protein